MTRRLSRLAALHAIWAILVVGLRNGLWLRSAARYERTVAYGRALGLDDKLTREIVQTQVSSSRQRGESIRWTSIRQQLLGEARRRWA